MFAFLQIAREGQHGHKCPYKSWGPTENALHWGGTASRTKGCPTANALLANLCLTSRLELHLRQYEAGSFRGGGKWALLGIAEGNAVNESEILSPNRIPYHK